MYRGWGATELSMKRRELTGRQAKAINNRVAGMSKRQALLDAGYSESVANTAASKVFERMDPQLRDAFAEAGLTLEHISKTVFELTDDPNGSVRLGAVKTWADLTGVEPAKRTQHEISGHLSVAQIRKEQSRLTESLGWLE